MPNQTGDARAAVTDQQLCEEVTERLAADLAMIVDRPLAVGAVATERHDRRAAGAGVVHVSFKLGFRAGGVERHGCVLVPLPDAISLAGYLMMVPDAEVEASRALDTIDRTTKEAMLEVGNLIGGATDAAIRGLFAGRVSAHSAGCQGVRADVRPAFPYREGDALIVGRARMTLHEYPSFEMILMLPDLEALAA